MDCERWRMGTKGQEGGRIRRIEKEQERRGGGDGDGDGEQRHNTYEGGNRNVDAVRKSIVMNLSGVRIRCLTLCRLLVRACLAPNGHPLSVRSSPWIFWRQLLRDD
jgi:hypothetical protein